MARLLLLRLAEGWLMGDFLPRGCGTTARGGGGAPAATATATAYPALLAGVGGGWILLISVSGCFPMLQGVGRKGKLL